MGEGADDGVVEEILALAEDARVAVSRVSRGKIEAVARTDSPQGVIATAHPVEAHDPDDLASGLVRSDLAPDGPPFLLALDGVTDPSELGLVLRVAAAAGVTGVLLPRHRAVHITPTVARAAAGAIEHLPLAVVPGLPAALARLQEQGVWTLGLDVAAERSLFALDAVDAPLALVVGAEVRGLSRLVRQRCDRVVAVPLAGPPDGLDTPSATALACFEVARHRTI